MFKIWKKLLTNSIQPKSKTKIFSVFLTVLLPDYEAHITSSLIKKGYTVGPANVSPVSVNKNDQLSYLINLNVYHMGFPDLIVSQLFDDVKLILEENKGFFYSIIIGSFVECSWTGSNMVVNQPKPIPQLTSKKDKLN